MEKLAKMNTIRMIRLFSLCVQKILQTNLLNCQSIDDISSSDASDLMELLDNARQENCVLTCLLCACLNFTDDAMVHTPIIAYRLQMF